MSVLALALAPLLLAAATPPPAPTPSPPSDPCGSILSIVNRPSFGTGVCTVRTGHFDVENGYTDTVTGGSAGGDTALYPQTLLRVGTFDPHLDFEFSPPSAQRSTIGGTITSGASDIALGAKYELGYTSSALWGINAIVTIPTGARAFTAGNAQYTGNFNWGYSVSSIFGLSGTLGFNAFSATNIAGMAKSYFAFEPTLLLSATLPGPSQVEAEYAYFSAAGPALGGRSWFDVIYARDVGPHVQLDVEYGLSPPPRDGTLVHYVGAGISFMN